MVNASCSNPKKQSGRVIMRVMKSIGYVQGNFWIGERPIELFVNDDITDEEIKRVYRDSFSIILPTVPVMDYPECPTLKEG